MIMLLVRAAFGIVCAIAAVVLFGHVFPRVLETGYLSQSRKGKPFWQELLKRWWIYFIPILLFSFFSIGSFLYPAMQFNDELKGALETVTKVVFSDPYEVPRENPLEEVLSFPFVHGGLWAGVVAMAIIVFLARILSAAYHPFLIRTLVFYTLAVLAFNIVIYIVNPAFHKVFIDYLVRPLFPEYMAAVLTVAIVTAGVTEGMISTRMLRWGHRAGTRVMSGAYRCTKCIERQMIKDDLGYLVPCKNCGWEYFSRER